MRALPVLAALLCATSTAQAALLSDLVAGGGTVADGDKLFSSFTCVSGGTGSTAGGCGTLNVAPLSGFPGENVGLRFTGGLSATGAGSALDVVIGYTVTVTDPTQAIKQISLDFNGTFPGLKSVNDAAVSVTEQVKNGGTVVGQITVSAPVDLQDPPFEDFVDIPLPGLFTTLNVTKDIIIATYADGVSGTISLIDQDFEQTGGSKEVVEPTTLAVLGTGLVLLGCAKQRRRRA